MKLYPDHLELEEYVVRRNLQYLMRAKRLTEADLTRNTGIAQPTLHKILSGKTLDPRMSTIKILAKYFSITIDLLYSSDITFLENMIPRFKLIPILSWNDCPESNFAEIKVLLNNQSVDKVWVNGDHHDPRYALLSKPSMEPYFIRNTLLIIGSDENAGDGDYVVVRYNSIKEATIRRLFIDGPDYRVCSIDGKLSECKEDANKNLRILGSLQQAVTNYYKTNKKEYI